MQDSSLPVVLVGKRNKALKAARKLGLKAIVADPAAPQSCELPRHAVRAVVAVTEGAVLRAAELRSSLGLAGLTLAAAHRCTDKLAMKQTIRAAGIPCAEFVPVSPGPLQADKLLTALGAPVILKHQHGFGGRGTIKALGPDALPELVAVPSLAESYIEGTEMSVESLVVDGVPVFVNFTEYVEPAWSNLLPADLDEETTAALKDINTRSITALGIERGMTHLEVFLTDSGVVFGELAARPPGGQIMRLITHAYGFDPWEALLAIEIGEPDRVAIPTAAGRCAAMRFIHPGAGVVDSIRGLTEVNALPSLTEFQCKLAPGDVVTAREGTGQHRGFVIFRGESRQVREDLRRFRQLLQIRMR